MAGIRLSQVAPWNDRLTNPYRTRYAQHGGRYFRIEANNLRDLWSVYEISEKGEELALVDFVWNLAQARLIIDLFVAGKTADEIDQAIRDAPRPGTGRNHPRNVARRQGFMRPGRHL